MLAQMEGKLGKNHSGELKHLSAEAKAERIIAEELNRLRWPQPDLALRLKGNPAKLAIASRLRSETILPLTWSLAAFTWARPRAPDPDSEDGGALKTSRHLSRRSNRAQMQARR